MDNITLNIEPASSPESEEEPPVVLLAVKNAEDRRLMKQFLPDYLSIESSDSIHQEQFDLCILDEYSFQRNKEALFERKKRSAPIFLPFLLLSQKQQQTSTDPTLLEFVDEVVYIPASTKVLQSRIKMLLQQRDYSLLLEEKNRELAEKNDQLTLYKQAVNATNEGVLITDTSKQDNPIIFCNEGFEELTGYSEEEVLGRNCRFLQNDDREQEAVSKLRYLIDAKQKGKVRIRNYRRDGTMFWNELSIAPIKDENGKSDYFVGIQRDITKLVETRQQLRKEKEQFRLITENSTDMISRHGPDGTYLYVSPSSQELIGYTPEELKGQNVFDNIHPDDRERFLIDEEMFSQKTVVRWTFRKQTKSGSYKWVETIMRPIRDENTDELKEIQASTRDISERKEYERKLREEKEFIDKAVMSLPELFYMIDEEQNFIKWNNIERDLGYTDQEVRRMHPLDFYRPEDRELVSEKIKEAFEKGRVETEIEMIDKKGEAIPYYVTARKFSRGEKDYLVGTCVNMSKVKRVQKKLEESRTRWKNLVENDPNLVQILAPDGTIEFINNSGAEILGFDDPRKLVGKNYFSFIEMEEEEFEVARQRMEKVIEGGKAKLHTFKIKDNYGRERYLESQAVPITLEGGEPGLQQVAQDITDRMKYERDLKESLLEKEVLLQEIHHRVKNNLAVVSGLLTIQRFKSEEDGINKVLFDCERRIKSMALIHEKLYQSESLSNVDFKHYIEDLVSTIKKTMGMHKSVQVNLNCDTINLNVNQAVPCGLIISELISNAFEHAFKGRKRGRINIDLIEKKGRVAISVSDNGVGTTAGAMKKKSSMGFTIINTLVSQLKASLDIQKANGTSVSFSFEKQEIKGSSSALLH